MPFRWSAEASLKLLATVGLALKGVGQLALALATGQRFDRFPMGNSILIALLVEVDPFLCLCVQFPCPRLTLDRLPQLVTPAEQRLGRQTAKLRAERLVVGGGLGAIALGRFGDVGKALAQVVRLWCELLAMGLNLWGRVEVGLLAAARGGDV
jgi:hypothetical protein